MPTHVNIFFTHEQFEQVERFIHISAPLMYANHDTKVSPAYYDKMMVRFTGRCEHTFRIKNKPIPCGYKVLALCDNGYTHTFLPELHVDKNRELETQSRTLERKALSVTGQKALMLRKRGVGACGTVRPNAPKYLPKLRLLRTKKLAWDKKFAIT
ncbi:hypothetical protein BGZ76_003113, partial [Entomortierella beljakovae]